MIAGNSELGFTLGHDGRVLLLTLVSGDGMNRLTRRKVTALKDEIEGFSSPGPPVLPLVISGDPIFSAGADLNEISQLNGPDALAFARMGQELMSVVAAHPAPVYAAIQGFCMGGGHRGAALGLITGWGGTQRLPRLVGKGRALEMFLAAEKITAQDALRIGLVDAIADDPVAESVRRLSPRPSKEYPG
jgi:enoyl-CoA hydratase/carnithine racemase